MLSLARLHHAIADAIPDRECIAWRHTSLSWRDVADRTTRLASYISGSGLGLHPGAAPRPWESPHDHVGLFMPNTPTHLESIIAVHTARAAPFNVNYRYGADELTRLLEDARPAMIIYAAAYADRLAAVLSLVQRRLGREIQLIETHGAGEPRLPRAVAYERVLAITASARLPESGPGDLHILYTGGTTGAPKGVLWPVGDLVAGPLGVVDRNGDPIEELSTAVARAVAGKGRALLLPPLMHGSGSWFSLSAMLRGVPLVVLPSPGKLDFGEVADECLRGDITELMLVGDAFARRFVAELDRRGVVLGSVRRVLNSGAALSSDVRRALSRTVPSARVTDAIGASESGPQSVRRPGEGMGEYQLARRGIVLHDDRRTVFAAGETGTGWLANPRPCAQGYLGDPERTRQTYPVLDGVRYAVPGDRVTACSDGSIVFLGRDATTINTGGEKVFAEEVEAVLRDVRGVSDIVVIGRESAVWGQEVVAIIELGPGISMTDAGLLGACAGRLAGYKLPKAFIRVDHVERMANGKVDRLWASALKDAQALEDTQP